MLVDFMTGIDIQSISYDFSRFDNNEAEISHCAVSVDIHCIVLTEAGSCYANALKLVCLSHLL
jgi:hypothetical protein